MMQREPSCPHSGYTQPASMCIACDTENPELRRWRESHGRALLGAFGLTPETH